MKRFIQKLFKLRTDVGLNFYVISLFYKYILLQNRNLKWHIHHTSTVHSPENIIRGKNVFPGDSPGNYIEASNGIIIGDYTNIGPNVGLISANHDVIDNTRHIKSPPIKIGKFCWLGMNVIILPGIELGDFCVVGAGAVVTNSFPEGYCIIAGNPAKVIKVLDKKECDQYRQTKLPV
jgi:acetyltransferase-like isoleucine patch superfamily enzyme